MRIEAQQKNDAEQDYPWALLALPASRRIDLARLLGHALER